MHYWLCEPSQNILISLIIMKSTIFQGSIFHITLVFTFIIIYLINLYDPRTNNLSLTLYGVPRCHGGSYGRLTAGYARGAALFAATRIFPGTRIARVSVCFVSLLSSLLLIFLCFSLFFGGSCK